MKERPELAAFALAAVVVAAAAVIAATGGVIPSWFPILALAAVTGGAGLAPGGAAAPVTDPVVSENVDYVVGVVDQLAADVTALKRRSRPLRPTIDTEQLAAAEPASSPASASAVIPGQPA